LIADQAESLFINQQVTVSVANAVIQSVGPVPRKKMWVFQAASYFPSAAETRTVQWCIINPAGTIVFAVSIPLTIALSSSIFLPLVTEGNEITLLPGQYLQVRRDVATAGSTMTINALFVELDMPLYHYTEPQARERIRKQATSALKQISGPSGGSSLGATRGGFGGFAPMRPPASREK